MSICKNLADLYVIACWLRDICKHAERRTLYVHCMYIIRTTLRTLRMYCLCITHVRTCVRDYKSKSIVRTS